MKKNYLLTFSLLAFAIILWVLPDLKIPVIDDHAVVYFDKTLTEAGIGYAACRSLNAGITVIQESNVTVSPFGLGINLAIGQILDPINDLVERASDIMISAIVALSAQRILYEIAVSLFPKCFAIVLMLSVLFVWIQKSSLHPLRNLLLRIGLLILLGRFLLPSIACANDFLQTHFFKNRIEAIQIELTLVSKYIEPSIETHSHDKNGILDKLKRLPAEIERSYSSLTEKLNYMVNHLEKTTANLLQLICLWCGAFIVQAVILPVISFWILLNITKNVTVHRSVFD